MNTGEKACCVFGHRKVLEKDEIREKLSEIFERLIVSENVNIFYLGSRSEFDDLCRQVLAVKKEKYPHIKRIYIRAEYPDINEDYENYLLKSCEVTYFPERAINGGKAVYVERNCEMIDKSDFCVVYFKDGYLPPRRKGGNKDLFDYQPKSVSGIAYNYAVRKKRLIINLAE